jgi:tetratricopeptide (TPR) repeat protein/DNA-binding CsgD family transcriptional regulator
MPTRAKGNIFFIIGVLFFALAMLITSCNSADKQYAEQDRVVSDHYNNLAQKYKDSNVDSTIYYAQLAIETSRILVYHESDKLSYYLLGYAYRLKGNLKKALESLLESQNRITPDDLETLDAEIYLLISNVYAELGQYDAALKNYHQTIKVFSSFDNDIGVGRSLNNISLIYYRIDDFEKAQDYNNQALRIWEKVDFPRGLASSLTINGYILTANGYYDSAISYHEHAQEIYKNNGLDMLYANSYLNIGDVYLQQGKSIMAEKVFIRSLELSRNQTFYQIYVDGLNKLGQAYTAQRKFEQAGDTLFKGLEEAKKINDLALLAEFYEHLAEMFDVNKDYKKAYQYQKLFEEHKYNIFKKERALRIAEFQVIYQTEQMRQQNLELEEENQRRLMYLYFSTILSVLIILLVILLYSRYRIKLKFLNQRKELDEKKIQQQELEFELEKNKNDKLEAEAKLKEEENAKLQMDIQHRHNELSSVTMHMYQKNESLSQLLEEVELIENKARPEVKKDLKTLKSAIKSNLQLDEDWNRFKMHFNQVHQGFIDRLSEEFPSLTNLDLRHCSYIRMNLSTKEISRLLNINPTSVQKSRVRLKKKLGLGKDDDLFDFLVK